MAPGRLKIFQDITIKPDSPILVEPDRMCEMLNIRVLKRGRQTIVESPDAHHGPASCHGMIGRRIPLPSRSKVFRGGLESLERPATRCMSCQSEADGTRGDGPSTAFSWSKVRQVTTSLAHQVPDVRPTVSYLGT